MLFEMSDNARKNTIAFLNRIEFKGIDESIAVVEIYQALNNPIEQEQLKEEGKKK